MYFSTWRILLNAENTLVESAEEEREVSVVLIWIIKVINCATVGDNVGNGSMTESFNCDVKHPTLNILLKNKSKLEY